MLRFLWRFVAFLAEMNGYTPFFQALFKAYLAIIVGGLSVLSGWVCSVFGTSRIYSFFQENFPYGLRHENSPEKECGGKRIRIKGKITGINCDRRDA